MAKLSSLVMEVVYALMFTVIGYVVVDYFMTSVASALSITMPAYFTTLGLGIVFIIIFFALVIYVISHAMKGGKSE